MGKSRPSRSRLALYCGMIHTADGNRDNVVEGEMA